jgi:outer membrane protein OmpA-like peptidoglycan-associated protein
VQRALRTLGITNTKVVGFGQEIPVRSNDAPDDRADNRRVELVFD